MSHGVRRTTSERAGHGDCGKFHRERVGIKFGFRGT